LKLPPWVRRTRWSRAATSGSRVRVVLMRRGMNDLMRQCHRTLIEATQTVESVTVEARCTRIPAGRRTLLSRPPRAARPSHSNGREDLQSKECRRAGPSPGRSMSSMRVDHTVPAGLRRVRCPNVALASSVFASEASRRTPSCHGKLRVDPGFP
jgi:hypothetical protein